MDSRGFKRYSILGQVLFWTLVFLGFFVEVYPWYPLVEALIDALISTSILATIAYTNYLVLLPGLFDRKKYFLYGLGLLSLTAAGLLLHFSLFLWLSTDYEEYTIGSFGLVYSPYYLLTIGVTSLYRFIEAWFLNFKVKANLENEKLKTELKFLKAQINPHFLFNTLNNIYSYAQLQHPDTPDMIGKLSEILRYMVYDCKEERVSLRREVEIAENLFSIYRLKNDEQENLEFVETGIKSRQQIAPLLIINLLENAFKHSDALSNPKGFIRCSIQVDDQDRLEMEVSNSVKDRLQSNVQEGKVGLENIKRQLDLIYKNNWVLDIDQQKDSFVVKLVLQLESLSSY